jgi:hypothetical protein
MAGRMKEADVLAALRAHRYALIQIGNVEAPASGSAADIDRFRFTRPVMQTMLAEYELVFSDGPYALLAPRR